MINFENKNKQKRRVVEPRQALSVVKKYDLLVFIGRFQPLHKGHQQVIDRALNLAHNVLLIVGSAGKARSTRNPFTFEDREAMIKSVYPDVIVEGVSDSAYDDTQWTIDVQDIVKRVGNTLPSGPRVSSNGNPVVGLIGMEKDHTSYYLKLFPEWGNEPVHQASMINATSIRELLFEGNHNRWELDAIMDDRVTQYIIDFTMTAEFDRLVAEHKYIIQYKKEWGEGPFLTGDSLVQVGGNILLIRRGKEYGHGLYALPGGFLKKHERFKDGALRELKEESRLKVPLPVLKGSIVKSDTFDMAHRSDRGRIITMCFHIKLENETSLPEVRGSDDAEWAGFVPISDLRDGTLKERDFFEDHFQIIRSMLGI